MNTVASESVARALARSRVFAFRLGLIVVAGWLARVAFIEWFGPHLHFGLDTTWYELTSGLIVDGKGFSDPATFFSTGRAVPTAFRVPLFPGFLALVTQAFDSSRHTFQLAGSVAGAVTIGLTGLLGRRVAGDRVGLLGAGVVAISPALWNVDASVMSETLQVPIVTGIVLALYWALDKPRSVRWVIVGLGFGFAILNRADAVVFLIVTLVVLVVVGRVRALPRVAVVTAVMLAAAVVVTPWLVRNHRSIGSATLSTVDSAEALAGANCASTYGFPRIGLWDPRCVQGVDAEMSEVDRRDELLRRGTRYAGEHVWMTPVVGAARALRVWGVWEPVTQSRDESVESRNTRWQLVVWAFTLMLLAAAVIGFAIARRRRYELVPIVALLIAVSVGAVATYGKQRFRVVAEPELAVLAAIALVAIWDRRSRRVLTR